ncbi:MAG: hypothetical protein JOS17DRAFT_597275 [Linnemannia elongata]|nr:MAG: hypothetical protein JOS17DRAFT_597275 [Linnemannia elongata]
MRLEFFCFPLLIFFFFFFFFFCSLCSAKQVNNLPTRDKKEVFFFSHSIDSLRPKITNPKKLQAHSHSHTLSIHTGNPDRLSSRSLERCSWRFLLLRPSFLPPAELPSFQRCKLQLLTKHHYSFDMCRLNHHFRRSQTTQRIHTHFQPLMSCTLQHRFS